MQTIVVGTHEYQWALHPLAYLHGKYWSPDPITWYGDRVEGPLPIGVEFRRVPAFCEGSWPWNHHFGRGLISILQELKSDVVCILLPDHWISDRVDGRGVWRLEKYMLKAGNVLRGNLTAGTCLDQHGVVVKRYKKHSIVSVSPNDHHCSYGGGLTFCPSLWNRELLLGLLEPGWNLWDCEKAGTEKFARTLWKDGYISAGVFPPPVHRCHGLAHATPDAANLTGLRHEDRDVVARMLPEGYHVL